jgi:hypothetical protein
VRRAPVVYLALILTAALVAAGCDSSPSGIGGCLSDYRAVDQALRQNRARWGGQSARSYEYVFERVCFCAPDARGPFRVRVENDRIVRSVPADAFSAVLTVPQVFDVIQEAIGRRACTIDVRYDASAGFPAEVFIDYVALAADEEMGFRIEGVVITR